MKKISVFGGSQPREGELAYSVAYRLGYLLGSAGYAILTGGYMGTMEAVSRGAFDAGGHVIGVTCNEIERWRPTKPNSWIQKEWRFERLVDRLFNLIESCDAAIALPGGPGTLAEISMMWTLLLTGVITPRPLILIGSEWSMNFDRYFQVFGDYVPDEQRRWLRFLENVDEAIQSLNV